MVAPERDWVRIRVRLVPEQFETFELRLDQSAQIPKGTACREILWPDLLSKKAPPRQKSAASTVSCFVQYGQQLRRLPRRGREPPSPALRLGQKLGLLA